MTATLTTTTAQGDDDVVWASPFQLATDETVDDNDRPVVRWALTHRATGLVVHADTLPDAMLYLSDPDAEGYLRHSAWDTALHPFATGEDKALMRRALVVFGDLLAPTVTPDHVCTCGGYLGRDAQGRAASRRRVRRRVVAQPPRRRGRVPRPGRARRVPDPGRGPVRARHLCPRQRPERPAV